MPAKKKARLAAARSSGPTSMSEVSKLQLAVRDWVQEVHAHRHVEDGDPSGVRGWSCIQPGTFRSIAKQAWANAGRLFKGSLDLLQKAGMMELGTTVEDLGLLAMKLQAPS